VSAPPSLAISVVICAYTAERWPDLVAAVDSVHRQTVPPHEIIVVVDHNPELLSLAHACLAGVVVVENREQPGLSGSRNSGVAAAQGAIVAFLDDDAVAAPEWLARLTAAYNTPHVIGVGGAIEPLWESARPRWFPAEFNWVVGCTYLGMPTRAAPVRNLIGCNMSFRREVFARVGGFRSGIGRIGARPVGCEETELCIRICHTYPHCVLLYEPRALVRHRVRRDRMRWRYFRQRCFSEGLSKAQVARAVGASAALSNERCYTTRVLPRGVVQGVTRTVLGRDVRGGLGRVVSITAGLAITTAGYLTGSLFVLPAAQERGWSDPLPGEQP
jgi:glycosyltransferase involved in cell wall biosynthesis